MNKQKKNLICKGCGESIGEIWGSEDPQLAPESGNEKEMHSENHEPMTFCGPACVEKYKSETKWNPDEGTQEMNQMNDYTDGEAKASEYFSNSNIEEHTEKDKDGNIILDIADAKISYKERNSLKSTEFLDKSRRSFPIRPGKECEDLSNALHRLGTYSGSIPRATLHREIETRMKKHGCTLPKSWDKDKKS